MMYRITFPHRHQRHLLARLEVFFQRRHRRHLLENLETIFQHHPSTPPIGKDGSYIPPSTPKHSSLASESNSQFYDDVQLDLSHGDEIEQLYENTHLLPSTVCDVDEDYYLEPTDEVFLPNQYKTGPPDSQKDFPLHNGIATPQDDNVDGDDIYENLNGPILRNGHDFDEPIAEVSPPEIPMREPIDDNLYDLPPGPSVKDAKPPHYENHEFHTDPLSPEFD